MNIQCLTIVHINTKMEVKMDNTTMSTAVQIILAIIPIVGIVIGGTVVFFYLLWRNSQISLLIKTDKYTQRNFNLKIFSLLTGFVLTMVGLVLTIIFILMNGASYSLLGGLIPLAIGISLLLFCKVYKDKE